MGAEMRTYVVPATAEPAVTRTADLPLAALVKIATEQYIISARLETIRSDAETARYRRRRGQSRPLP